MRDGETFTGTVLETERLRLRPLRTSDAELMHRLWAERDPRVPPHRRIGPDGRPTVADLAARLATPPPRGTGMFAIERLDSGAVVGYCGLVEAAPVDGEPELGYELLRAAWNRGIATEAARAVLDRATSIGCTGIRAGVWEWNSASRRVLEKLGFVEVQRVADPAHGMNLMTRRPLP